MQINILFVLLILMTVILIAQNTSATNVALIIVTVVNLLLVLQPTDIIKMAVRPSNLNDIKRSNNIEQPTLIKSFDQPAGLATAVDGVNSVDIYKGQILSPYGEFYDRHQAYNDLLSKPAQLPVAQSCSERVRGVDGECARMGQRRTRDKRSMDAASTKTADYYAYNYAEELDQAEQKVWWNNYDI